MGSGPPKADKALMKYFVYVLQSLTTRKRYIGYTADLVKRVSEHNSGLSIYTKNRGPWKVVHIEKFSDRVEAIRRERFLKSGKGREYLSNLRK